jgi:hypothetical protein
VGTNRYAYALNDPINKRDPNGSSVGAVDQLARIKCDATCQEYDREFRSFVFRLAPVVGSGSDAFKDFENGQPVWGTVNVGLAIADGATLGGLSKLLLGGKVVAAGVKMSMAGLAVRRVGQGSFRKALIAAGKLNPARGEIAHHIVEYSDPFAAQSRALLAHWGVDVHSVVNGIGLANTSGPHTIRYSEAVYERLFGAETRREAEERLEQIGRELKSYDQSNRNVDDWARDQLRD